MACLVTFAPQCAGRRRWLPALTAAPAGRSASYLTPGIRARRTVDMRVWGPAKHNRHSIPAAGREPVIGAGHICCANRRRC